MRFIRSDMWPEVIPAARATGLLERDRAGGGYVLSDEGLTVLARRDRATGLRRGNRFCLMYH